MNRGGFRSGKGCVDLIFTLNKLGDKAREKKQSYVGFERELGGKV